MTNLELINAFHNLEEFQRREKENRKTQEKGSWETTLK